MRDRVRHSVWARILCVLLMLLPVALLFFLPAEQPLGAGPLLWLLLPICFWLMLWMMNESPEGRLAAQEPAKPRMLLESEQPMAVRQVMDVRVATLEASGTQLFRGPLRETAASAYANLSRAVDGGPTVLLQEDGSAGAAIMLVPKADVDSDVAVRKTNAWVHWILLLLTLGTTTWAGAAHQGVDLLQTPSRFAVGLPYSLGLLTILGIHELGHYFAARYHGIRVTPPYFIPIPFALGTFGAFIQMRSPTQDRKALFDVAAAGPLAGLAIAIPALVIGLSTSTILPGGDAASMAGTSAGSSILFALIAKFSLGSTLNYGHAVHLSPLAFAGWLGLLITGLNLLPIGQLDGGHISHAVFGWRLGERIGTAALWSLTLLAIFVWPGLLMWAILIFFIAGTAVPPLNDVTPLPPKRRWVGYGVFLVTGLILAPLPHALWTVTGLHCPYI